MSSLLFALLNAIRALIPCPLASLPPRARIRELVSFFAVLPFRVCVRACSPPRRSYYYHRSGKKNRAESSLYSRLNKQAPRLRFFSPPLFSRLPHVRILPFFFCCCAAAASTLFTARVSSTRWVSSSILRLYQPLVCFFLFFFMLFLWSIISCSLSSLV